MKCIYCEKAGEFKVTPLNADGPYIACCADCLTKAIYWFLKKKRDVNAITNFAKITLL